MNICLSADRLPMEPLSDEAAANVRARTSRHQPTGLARIAHWLTCRAEELDRRRRVTRLLDHDDRMLDDMGLDRFSIEEGLALPLSVNVLDYLHGDAKGRSRR